MDDQELRKQLKTVILSLQKLLAQLEPGEKKEPVEIERTICPFCDELLADGTRIIKGVHERCYQALRRQNRLVDAEQRGILLPNAKTGRPVKHDIDEILNAKKLEEIAIKKTGEHRKKPKP